jgi:peptide/nickel transport system permease protein
VAVPVSEAPVVSAAFRPGRRLTLLREVVSRPAGAFGLVVVLLLIAAAIAPSLFAPYGQDTQDIPSRLQGPTLNHLLGTDELGRDLLSRLIFSCRVELGVAVPSVLAALIGGLILGVLAGYRGGMLDNALIVVMDSLQAFPAVILALVLLALLGSSLQNVIIVIAVAFVPNYARVSRALVLALKNNQFVEAERSLGASPLRMILVHVVPNIVAPLFILLAMDIPGAITTEAGLSFLGLGVQPPTASWGVMLSDGFARVQNSAWGVITPGVALMLATLAFTLLGETLRDVFDPKLSGVRRWRRR